MRKTPLKVRKQIEVRDRIAELASSAFRDCETLTAGLMQFPRNVRRAVLQKIRPFLSFTPRPRRLLTLDVLRNRANRRIWWTSVTCRHDLEPAIEPYSVCLDCGRWKKTPDAFTD